jgi:hypothetical protein
MARPRPSSFVRTQRSALQVGDVLSPWQRTVYVPIERRTPGRHVRRSWTHPSGSRRESARSGLTPRHSSRAARSPPSGQSLSTSTGGWNIELCVAHRTMPIELSNRRAETFCTVSRRRRLRRRLPLPPVGLRPGGAVGPAAGSLSASESWNEPSALIDHRGPSCFAREQSVGPLELGTLTDHPDGGITDTATAYHW